MCVVCVTMSSKKTGGRGARGFKKGASADNPDRIATKVFHENRVTRSNNKWLADSVLVLLLLLFAGWHA